MSPRANEDRAGTEARELVVVDCHLTKFSAGAGHQSVSALLIGRISELYAVPGFRRSRRRESMR